MPKSSWTRALRLAVAFGLLAAVLHLTDARAVAARVASIDRLALLASLGLFLAGQGLNALRWRWLLGLAVSSPPRWAFLFTLVMVGMFANFLMPSSVGGDIVRAELVRTAVGGRTHAYFSVLVGRVLGLFSVVAIGVGAMAGAYLATGWFQAPIVAAGVGVALAAAAVCALALRGTIPPTLARGLPERRRAALACLQQALRAYASRPTVLWLIFVVAVFANAVGTVGVVWTLAEGLRLPVPGYFHFIAVPLVMLAALVPVSVNGVGVREGAFAVLYGMAGLDAAGAVSLSLAFTAVLASGSLIGGLALLVPRRAWPGAPPSNSEAAGTEAPR